MDNKVVFRGGSAPVPMAHMETIVPNPRLSGGIHNFEVRFSTGGQPWCNISWTRPGGQDEAIQPDRLQPVFP